MCFGKLIHALVGMETDLCTMVFRGVNSFPLLNESSVPECAWQPTVISHSHLFLLDEKPTIVKDGYVLCPAPVLTEVGQ